MTEVRASSPMVEAPDPGGRPAAALRRIRLCIVVTVDITIQHLCRGRLEYLASRGFDITVVCAPTPLATEIEARGVRLFTAPLRRAITPLTDLRCLIRLWRFFRRERFDVIEVSTPKAALLGAIAARLAGARCVVHMLRGLVYQGQGPVQRLLLRWSLTIPCRLAHHVLSVSHSMREQAARDGLCSLDRMAVLGEGSSNGVDLGAFSPRLREKGLEIRRLYGIPADAVVIGFIGRMTRDKGLVELVEAFRGLGDGTSGPYLLIVGAYEARDRPPGGTVDAIASDPRIKHVGWQDDTTLFLAAMDVLSLPSHREGFNNVLLHAGACGIPVVTTDVVGCRDAMRDGVTGLAVAVGDPAALGAALRRLVEDGGLRERMGAEGRRWVERSFAQERIWSMQESAFRGMLTDE